MVFVLLVFSHSVSRVVVHRSFGIAYPSHLQGSKLFRNVGKQLPTNAELKDLNNTRRLTKKKNLRQDGRSQNLPGTYRLVASSPANKRITSVYKMHSDMNFLNENYYLQHLHRKKNVESASMCVVFTFVNKLPKSTNTYKAQ
jgi:hypothetical protein